MNFELKLRKVTVFLKFGIILLLFPLGVFAQGNGLYEFRGDDYKYGFMDNTGKVIIKPKYNRVRYPGFCEGLVFVSEKQASNGDYRLDAIINKKGEILSKYEMHSYMGFQGDLIKFYDRGDYLDKIYKSKND